jgi:2-polyprenyl-3-methyl-5-hydroxy-6-metoxy-1,4-benzoquinol methylase
VKIKKYFFIYLIFSSINLNSEQILISNFDENEYQRVEKVFANNQGHIDYLVDFISSNLITKGEPQGSFLDIGPGPATITERLSKFFKTTTVIEPNKVFAPIFDDKGFVSYLANFQDITINLQYDIVLCSHVLYHVPQTEWAPFLEKLHGLIRSGGYGVVTMVAPAGKRHALMLSINPDYSNGEKVAKALKELNIPYELVRVQSTFNVPDYEDFRALVRLFTIDDCYLPETYRALSDSEKKSIEQKIDDYIVTCKQSDGSYAFLDEDVYILIRK